MREETYRVWYFDKGGRRSGGQFDSRGAAEGWADGLINLNKKCLAHATVEEYNPRNDSWREVYAVGDGKYSALLQP